MMLPQRAFFLFGMGARRKLLYRAGVLCDAMNGALIEKWDVAAQRIRASEYAVELVEHRGRHVEIREDEEGVWANVGGAERMLTAGRLTLPSFDGHPQRDMLRVLHHEILVNIVDGKPLPNLFVYARPWYRDAAMMAMCLERTGNVALIRDWILSLREPYDRNNAGVCEPDNLGQLLYLVSLVSDAAHPVVSTVLAEVAKWRQGDYISGMTDYAPHPVYQTQWLKCGLARLGLDDAYQVPVVADEYGDLCWWAPASWRADAPRSAPAAPCMKERPLYPYLDVARRHYYHQPLDSFLYNDGYPLTWEAQASQADYSGMMSIDPVLAVERICVPHTWHAAELFLYLLDTGGHVEEASE